MPQHDSIKGRDILSLEELAPKQIIRIIDLADQLKTERKAGICRPMLKGKSIAMIFQKPSTRTRVSMEVAAFELGAHALNLSPNELQLSRGETIEDTGRTLAAYVDLIAARVYAHNDVVRLAEASTRPVVNLLSEAFHPCQTLADLQTIRASKGTLQNLKIAWIGDGNNVCRTTILAARKLGLNMDIASPRGYLPREVELSKEERSKGAKIRLLEEPEEAVQGADVVMTDTFVSMGTDAQREERVKAFLPRYQVNKLLFNKAKKDSIFMHCLPAHRSEEVTDDVIDHDRSWVWEQAENRLHTEKALLCMLLLDESELYI
jgi:ornithine carbamoyltransferase